jgi:hypothetical protein
MGMGFCYSSDCESWPEGERFMGEGRGEARIIRIQAISRRGLREAHTPKFPAQILGRFSFAANDVVALDNCGDADRLVVIVLLLIDAHNASVRSYKHFGTARNFRR